MGNYTLSNGLTIPNIGFGTADINGDVKEIVKGAVKSGFKLIDTAPVYGSEKYVGAAIDELCNEGLINRADILIETKLDPSMHGYDKTVECIEKSLELLKTDYIDIFLIHWPVPRGNEADYRIKNCQTWKAMEEYYKAGKIKAIGVCNFLERHLYYLEKECEIYPMINQLELHPGYQQRGLVEYCREKNMVIEAWSPMGRGILKQEKFLEMAERYGRNIGQIALRWGVQKGFIPMTRTSSLEHIKSNIDIFDYEINVEDMVELDALNSNDGHDSIWSYKRQQMY